MQIHDIFIVLMIVSGLLLCVGAFAWLEYSANSNQLKADEIHRAKLVVDSERYAAGNFDFIYWLNKAYIGLITSYRRLMIFVAIVFSISVAGVTFV